MLFHICVGKIWSIKFNIDVSVSWIVNIMAATVLLYVHHCSLGDHTSMAPEQCQQSLLTLRGVDYCLHKKRFSL